MSVTRYSPFADFPVPFRTFEDAFTRLFQEAGPARPWVPAVDILEDENQLVVKADLPDVELKDIDIRIENGTLTIQGQRHFEKQADKAGYHRIERSYGRFARSFAVPETVDAEKVAAAYKNGVLTVTLAKKELAKPRTIQVQVS